MKNFKFWIILIALLIGYHLGNAQTILGDPNKNSNTKLYVYEYYHHTVEQEWIKLFSIKNYNPSQGFWGKGGVAGRAYFVDYQGSGGSYIDFSFPQKLSGTQKPILQLSGNSANQLQWYAKISNENGNEELYDVYIKTPIANLGLTFLIRGNDFTPYFQKENTTPTQFTWSSNANPESFSFFNNSGNIGFGTLNPTEKLSVNGKIRAKEVKVEAANWPDYVFEEGYKVGTLEVLESYIKTHKHLPGMPSAKDVEANGIAVSEMLKLQQQKIEELTLQLIELSKKVETQNADLKGLKNKK
ncbi:hypothetical protein OQX63_17585 [Pedobacter sp. PF22-3]|uniref:hypothetical protein n=1 Tax=Pedobacter sp. PF22-3 TaxID=2994467 RepID=UPI0022479451|nr:hypothetical protein [Pedobacter sp. PF22-3]MCX2495307.1 hypothetical protein [Pedobacter sp. PF22-3]